MEEKDFDGMSYSGLTRCIRGRIQDLREYRKFRKEHGVILRDYTAVRLTLFFRTKMIEMEIRELLSMRRRLRKSPYCNWYTTRIEEYEKAFKEKVIDIRKYRKHS